MSGDHSLTPGMLVQMRTLRRFSNYNAGELIAVSMPVAQDLHLKHLATPVHIMVPAGAEEPAPARQPSGLVKK